MIYIARTPGEVIAQAIEDGRTEAVSFGKRRGWWVLEVVR